MWAAVSANAQDVQEAERQFDRIWSLASEPERLADQGLHLRFSLIDVSAPPTEIQRLRRETANRPEHPELRRLAQYERHARGEFTEVIYEYWKRGDVWRLRTNHRDGSHPVDYAVSDGVAWQWAVGRQLSVFRPGPGVAVPEYDFTRFAQSFWLRMASFDSGGLSLLGKPRMQKPELEFEGPASWVAVTRNETENLRITGSFDGTLRVLSIRHQMQLPAAVLVTEIDSTWGEERVREIRERTNGLPTARYVLHEYGTVSQADLDKLVAVPSDDRPDPIHGRVPIGLIDDATGSVRTRTVLLDGRRIVEGTSPSPVTASYRARIAGAVLIVVIIIAVLAWKAVLRRNSQSQSTGASS